MASGVPAGRFFAVLAAQPPGTAAATRAGSSCTDRMRHYLGWTEGCPMSSIRFASGLAELQLRGYYFGDPFGAFLVEVAVVIVYRKIIIQCCCQINAVHDFGPTDFTELVVIQVHAGA